MVRGHLLACFPSVPSTVMDDVPLVPSCPPPSSLSFYSSHLTHFFRPLGFILKQEKELFSSNIICHRPRVRGIWKSRRGDPFSVLENQKSSQVPVHLEETETESLEGGRSQLGIHGYNYGEHVHPMPSRSSWSNLDLSPWQSRSSSCICPIQSFLNSRCSINMKCGWAEYDQMCS